MARRAMWALVGAGVGCGGGSSTPDGGDTGPAFVATCSGMITSRNGADPFDGGIAIGDPFTVAYGYDPALADEDPDPTSYVHARIEAPPIGMRVTAKQWTFETLAAIVSCNLVVKNDNDPGHDRFQFDCGGLIASPQLPPDTTAIIALVTLYDPTRTMLTTDVPPAGPLDVATAGLTEVGFSGNTWNFFGTLAECE